jgi:two-component system sensor histidine kinase YesM
LLNSNQELTITSSDDSVYKEILESYRKNSHAKPLNFMDNIGNKKYLIAYRELGIKELTLITYTPESDVMGVLRKFNILFIALFSVCLVVLLMFSFSVNLMIHKPIKKLMEAFKEFELNNLEFSIVNKSNNEFGYLYSGFNNMIRRIKQSIQQNYEQKLSMQQSELKQLQSQINPHFLYNSFFTINRMCKIGENEKLISFTQSLAGYYQFITRSDSVEVPLSKEYRHAMDYVEIQSIRFTNRVTVIADDLPKECHNLMVPRIIIQPVIENAFEHVFEKNVAQGIIRIEVTLKEDVLTIGIQDNGPPLDDSVLNELQRKLLNPSEVEQKTGIINVSRRIQLKFGEGSGLFITRGEYGGVKVNIIIKGVDKGWRNI